MSMETQKEGLGARLAGAAAGAVKKPNVAVFPVLGVITGIGAFVKRWVTTTDHKEIGILYIVTSFSFFVLGGVMALLMRTNLAYPGASIVDNGTCNRLFSTHGTVMIFLFIIPVLVGFSNYFVP